MNIFINIAVLPLPSIMFFVTGRLFGGVKLIQAMGFESEQNGTVFALRDSAGRVWDTLPNESRVTLTARLLELKSREQALAEPSVSNIAAGILIL